MKYLWTTKVEMCATISFHVVVSIKIFISFHVVVFIKIYYIY